jgi:hypothetical protein
MCEFCHVVGFVELGWIDLVDGIGFHLLLGTIVALDENSPFREILDYPSADERSCWIPKPDIALP